MTNKQKIKDLEKRVKVLESLPQPWAVYPIPNIPSPCSCSCCCNCQPITYHGGGGSYITYSGTGCGGNASGGAGGHC